MKQLVIPSVEEIIRTNIPTLVEQIIEKQKVEPRYPYHLHEQQEIDRIAYALYGLEPEDIREIELWFCRRYDTLAISQKVMEQVKAEYADHLARCEYVLAQPPGYWTSHPLLRRIAEGEGARIEFKETLAVDTYTGDPKDAEKGQSLKEIAAFLNTGGGELLIGVSDKGEIKGIGRDLPHCNHKNENGLIEKINQMVTERLQPLPHGLVQPRVEPLPGGSICLVQVAPSATPVYLNGDIYTREGNITKKLTTQQAAEWMQKRSAVSA